MSAAQLVRKTAWLILAASIVMFIFGVWLLRDAVCHSHGPDAFVVSVFLCATATLLFGVDAFQRRSFRVAGGAVAVALLGGAMLFASIGLAVPGCSGV